LLLAGDIISNKHKKKARWFYEQVEKDFKYVISTMGNHEFYEGEVAFAYPFYQRKVAENHFKMNNRSMVIGDVKFIVSTLWSYVPSSNSAFVSSALNDYKLIQHKNVYNDKWPMQVSDSNRYHKISLEFLQDELEKDFEGDIVVMTHHMPSFKCITSKPVNNNLNCAYASNLEKLIESYPKIKYWFCGHSHDFNIIKIGSTQVIRNPLGYVALGEEQGFKRDFVVQT